MNKSKVFSWLCLLLAPLGLAAYITLFEQSNPPTVVHAQCSSKSFKCVEDEQRKLILVNSQKRLTEFLNRNQTNGNGKKERISPMYALSGGAIAQFWVDDKDAVSSDGEQLSYFQLQLIIYTGGSSKKYRFWFSESQNNYYIIINNYESNGSSVPDGRSGEDQASEMIQQIEALNFAIGE